MLAQALGSELPYEEQFAPIAQTRRTARNDIKRMLMVVRRPFIPGAGTTV
jgi:hypothetical protein